MIESVPRPTNRLNKPTNQPTKQTTNTQQETEQAFSLTFCWSSLSPSPRRRDATKRQKRHKSRHPQTGPAIITTFSRLTSGTDNQIKPATRVTWFSPLNVICLGDSHRCYLARGNCISRRRKEVVAVVVAAV